VDGTAQWLLNASWNEWPTILAWILCNHWSWWICLTVTKERGWIIWEYLQHYARVWINECVQIVPSSSQAGTIAGSHCWQESQCLAENRTCGSKYKHRE
jgi:hypothetical protein